MLETITGKLSTFDLRVWSYLLSRHVRTDSRIELIEILGIDTARKAIQMPIINKE